MLGPAMTFDFQSFANGDAKRKAQKKDCPKTVFS
tara:strand:- start:130 stop:231 length:102 start_codon:yes stop_codon:yes gene_type:complete